MLKSRVGLGACAPNPTLPLEIYNRVGAGYGQSLVKCLGPRRSHSNPTLSILISICPYISYIYCISKASKGPFVALF